MKDIAKTGLVLFMICAVCAVLCAWVNSFTAPQIEENLRLANKRALEAVAGSYEVGETKAVSGHAVVKEETPLMQNGKVAGYALQLSGSGYGGQFTIIAAYDAKGALLKAKMTSDSETAGLGKKAENDWYMDIFTGMGDTAEFPASKNDLPSEQTALVNGASVTFKGVTVALKGGSSYIKEAH